jgi:hypothetical protein
MRYFYCIAALWFFSFTAQAQSYGLVFNSHEVVQEKRSSLDCTPDDSLNLAGSFDLSFDISFLPHREIYFGYIFRIIATSGGAEENIDLIYNQALHSFKVIVGENFSGISFSVDSGRLAREWVRFALHTDLDHHSLRFSVDDRPVGTSPLPVLGTSTGAWFKFLWGANDYRKYRTRDIPPMQLKDIRLESGAQHLFWPLDETTGEAAAEKGGGHAARIKNPIWLKPKYQQWELVGSFTVNGYAGAAYDPKHDRLYIAGDDSIASYGFTSDGFSTDWTPTRHMEFLVGHQNLYDTLTGRLLDIFIDRKSVAAFNPATRQWDLNFNYGPLTEYWHSNKFLFPGDSSLYTIGGYGQLRYKNIVQRYHFSTHRWDTIKTEGDYLAPHYLAALGATDKYAYILGGYGSHTGDQMLDPRNYYDLFRFDPKHHSFKRLLTLKPGSFPYTFANSMVLAPNGAWYALLFPNDAYNVHLQLIKGSLTDSAVQPVGTPIPYNFHDIQSFADLYYSPISNKLIAVTLFYSKYTADNQKVKNTGVRIYTLNYPPEPATAATTAAPERQSRDKASPMVIRIEVLVAALALMVFAIFRIRRRRKPAAATVTASSPPPPIEVEPEIPSQPIAGASYPSHIYLFGPFQAIDRDNNDCTRLFTPLLKELFLIITTYTIRNGRGISSEGLNELLWNDKAEKDAKNNRSVNLAKLKPILEKIGNCSITKEAAYWQLHIGEDACLDYKTFTALVNEPTPPDTQRIHKLVDLIKRGPFLFQTEYNWLDDIKSEVSNAVIDRCGHYLRLHGDTENPEFIIEIANCIFYFDQLNEDALTVKCKNLIRLKRHNLASNTYLKFAKDYKDIYNADFPRSFQQIIA